MCIQSGKVELYVDDNRGYIKGRIGKSFYIPPSGQDKLRQWVRANIGKVAEVETVRGMLVKVNKVGG